MHVKNDHEQSQVKADNLNTWNFRLFFRSFIRFDQGLVASRFDTFVQLRSFL
jgi:hypothetical protein